MDSDVKYSNVVAPVLGWSKFATARHRPGTGYTYFTGCTAADVVELVRRNWRSAVPGDGEQDLRRKVVVPIPAENFYCTSVPLAKDMVLHSEVYGFSSELAIKTVAKAKPVPAKFVKVVCFSTASILETFGEASCDSDWEIVVVLAAQIEVEPMHPLSMARNFLQTPVAGSEKYTAQAFAESIRYWSQRVQVSDERPEDV